MLASGFRVLHSCHVCCCCPGGQRRAGRHVLDSARCSLPKLELFLSCPDEYRPAHENLAILMLNCRACLWRCIQALDVPTTNAHRLRRHVDPLLIHSQQRLFSTRDVARVVDPKPVDLTQVERLSRNRGEP